MCGTLTSDNVQSLRLRMNDLVPVTFRATTAEQKYYYIDPTVYNVLSKDIRETF